MATVPRARGSAARGTGLAAPGRTINVGGGAGGGLTTRGGAIAGGGGGLATRGGAIARGGTGGLKRTSNDPYRGSSAIVIGSQAGAKDRGRNRKRTNAPAPAASAGGRDQSRRNAAIRELIRRGGTPGERAAAAAAAARLGI
ncbi:MAG: hypothetical protein HWQ38_05320 [Nostoc sp. NMS7]|uniref:hypothetical protein n=1 Tax=Nostoc sp. NMS7 TaxID=2815391 RepID=UPI0025EE5C7A|nr:hypothetical protein [Nostoc sp. NMS7]MBN3945925.1 hypothetical protein [Nostoc sp. NMS7]